LSALYEALDQEASPPSERRAIKETLLDDSDAPSSSQAADQFMRRAGLLASLDHPAIPKTLDYFVLRDRTYLVMEYIEGEDVEDILSDPTRDLPVAEILRWAVELGEVLHYLHTCQPMPIIYRDLKPSNIMIDSQGRVRLVDFGIADMFPQQHTHNPLGTDGYAAPEQYDGQVSPAIDIYAFGATLHHLLTRRDPRLEPPFSFDTVSIRDVNPLVPPELEAVVMRALSLDPGDRFLSVADMLEALRQIWLSETGHDS
jgi:serine/threonine protein kinase